MIILSSKGSIPSAKLLRDALQEISGWKIFVSTNPEKNCSVGVRYGSTLLSSKIKSDTALNAPEFISRISHKGTFANVLLENGLNAPVFHNTRENVEYPCLIRKTLTGQGGAGIVVCKTEEDFNSNWNNNYHWTKFIPMTKEYRAHIVGGKIVKLFEKQLIEETDKEFPIRNNDSCHFSVKDGLDGFPKLHAIVEKLTTIFGEGFFYALDVGYNKELKDYFIIEANSAPGLNENTAKIYAEYLYGKLKS